MREFAWLIWSIDAVLVPVLLALIVGALLRIGDRL